MPQEVLDVLLGADGDANGGKLLLDLGDDCGDQQRIADAGRKAEQRCACRCPRTVPELFVEAGAQMPTVGAQ
jgi:hypothetical protein